MSDYSRLKELAEQATPGPWKAQHPNAGQRGSEVAGSDGLNQVCADLGPTNSLYIAAANPAVVLDLIAENERLEACYGQFEKTLSRVHCMYAKRLLDATGERQDVLLPDEDFVKYFEELKQLKAECEGLRATLTDCSDSLHSEMLGKFGGQMPDDMHPVTRREYDRDMAEVAGYRAVLEKGASQ